MEPIEILESDCEELVQRIPRITLLDSDDERAAAQRRQRFESLFPAVTIVEDGISNRAAPQRRPLFETPFPEVIILGDDEHSVELRRRNFESRFPRVTTLSDSDDYESAGDGDESAGETREVRTRTRARASQRNTRRLMHLPVGPNEGEGELFWIIFQNNEIARVYADRIKRTLNRSFDQDANENISIDEGLTAYDGICLKAKKVASDTKKCVTNDLMEYLLN